MRLIVRLFGLLMALIIGLMGLSGCAGIGPQAQDAPKDDNLVVPGWRVGPIYIGMPTAEVQEVLGRPREVDYSTSAPQFFTTDMKLWV